jgi:hypothetical protein
MCKTVLLTGIRMFIINIITVVSEYRQDSYMCKTIQLTGISMLTISNVTVLG